MRILNNTSSILNSTVPNYRIDFNEKEISLILSSVSEKNLVHLSLVSPKPLQKKIQQKIQKSLRKKANDELYYKALINDIIQPNEEHEKHLLSTASNSAIENNYIVYCANLFMDDKIIDKVTCIELIKRDNSLSLVVNPDEFDFTQFEVESLKELSAMALEKISQSTKVYDYIHTELKKHLSNNHDEKLMEIYVKFFS